MTARRLPATLLMAAGAAAGLAAQQVFRGGTDLVLLTITVTDAAGRLVAGLDHADFVVYEDGIRQDTSNFSRLPQPVALSLVMDTSTSMEPRLPIAQQAAIGFVGRLGPHDIAQVLEFDSQTRILMTFTSDKDALVRAIRRTAAGGSTSLYNAIYTAISELNRVRSETGSDIRRQAIVLLSDGEDTSSLLPFSEVLDLARRSDVVVYAVGLREKNEQPTRGWNEAEHVLRSLAQETGWRSFVVAEIAQLPGVYSQIADELANQYTLAYVSTNTRRDGAWRRIQVQVTRGGMPARAKAGYFGPRAPK